MTSLKQPTVTLESLSLEVKELKQEGLARTETIRSLVRVEKKLDEVMKMMRALAPQAPLQLLSHTGQVCPLCQNAVHYLPLPSSGGESRTIRMCGCEPTPTQLVGGMRR